MRGRERLPPIRTLFLEQKLSDFNGLKKLLGTSLVVQWLGPHASTAGDLGSISDGGTKVLQTLWCHKNKIKYHFSFTFNLFIFCSGKNT